MFINIYIFAHMEALMSSLPPTFLLYCNDVSLRLKYCCSLQGNQTFFSPRWGQSLLSNKTVLCHLKSTARLSQTAFSALKWLGSLLAENLFHLNLISHSQPVLFMCEFLIIQFSKEEIEPLIGCLYCTKSKCCYSYDCIYLICCN